MNDKYTISLAYGSNLNIEDMKERCPEAEIIGTGILENYRLLFKGDEKEAFLTIEKKEGSVVPVGLWKLSPSDEIALDEYEEYPQMYYKENLPVKTEKGEVIFAMAYVMRKDYEDNHEFNLPSSEYLRSVIEGYKNFKFDGGYLLDALEKSIRNLEKK